MASMSGGDADSVQPSSSSGGQRYTGASPLGWTVGGQYNQQKPGVYDTAGNGWASSGGGASRGGGTSSRGVMSLQQLLGPAAEAAAVAVVWGRQHGRQGGHRRSGSDPAM